MEAGSPAPRVREGDASLKRLCPMDVCKIIDCSTEPSRMRDGTPTLPAQRLDHLPDKSRCDILPPLPQPSRLRESQRPRSGLLCRREWRLRAGACGGYLVTCAPDRVFTNAATNFSSSNAALQRSASTNAVSQQAACGLLCRREWRLRAGACDGYLVTCALTAFLQTQPQISPAATLPSSEAPQLT
jgi:hypothetical protein